MNIMFNPPHPGEILREDYLIPLNISVTRASENLGVTRKTLSLILNERAGISPAMAIKLSIACNTTPDFWMNLQSSYDLFQAKDNVDAHKIKTFA
ncbi:MAG: HigA family addiction module antitoxin [Bacteroidia bacterium]|nr:HigA family addiction module antitoxin [Bacteroidia bacterium]